MNVVAIIQARMGSTRLPGKVLADIAGVPMVLRIVQRVAAAQRVHRTVVATTALGEDDILVERLRHVGISAVFRGSTDDVLARFFECAKRHKADVIVRVTADDPLKDPEIIDRAVDILLGDPSLDYCSNTIEPSYPEGLDIEVFRFAALSRAQAAARMASDREHVTPYIWRQPTLFNLHSFKAERDLSNWRWTVDKPEDLEFMRRVYGHFVDRPLVQYQDVVAWLDANPEIQLINGGTPRNEGYANSLKAERP